MAFSLSTGTTNYTLHGKNIVHMTQGSNSLHFFYDASNKPAIVDFNGTKYAYVHNLQGDIVAILDSNGSVVVQYKYDAWGRPISKTGSMASTLGTLNPFRYRGYVYDEETGLYYLRSRYYNPVLTRFVIADIFIKPALNQYRYCAPNSIVLADPDGTTEWSCCYFDPYSDPMNINRSFFSGGLMTVDMGNALPVDGLKAYDVLTTMPPGFCSDRFGGALPSTYGQSSQSLSGERMSVVRAQGNAGEAAVGYEKNTQRIPSLTETAAYRVPDILNENFVGEVKNYTRPVRLTPQIIDEILYADTKGIPFVLFTDAPLAPSLKQLHDNNVFILRNIFK